MKKLLLLTLVLLGGFSTAFADGDTWSLRGDFNSWSGTANVFSKGQTTVSLTAGEITKFKIVKVNGDVVTWYGRETSVDWNDHTNCIFTSNNNTTKNCALVAAAAGTYTFTLTTTGDNPSLTVTYPDWGSSTTVYFSNSVNWAQPYVYILGSASYWDDSKGSGSEFRSNGIAMEQIGTSNIWKAEYPACITTPYIAFTKERQNGYGNFWQTEAIYKTDFPNTPCIYVPNASGSSNSKNETKYYYDGEWQYAITPGKEYTTYVTSDKVDFTGLELKAYVAKSASTAGVVFDEVTTVPANTPLLLKGTKGTLYSVPVAASADDIDVNLLLAGDGSTTIGGDGNYDYILSDGKFYRALSGTVAVGKAYLHLTKEPALAQELSIIFSDDEETDGINAVKGMMPEVIGESYNLAGQKVGANYKGIVIVNGKKVVRK